MESPEYQAIVSCKANLQELMSHDCDTITPLLRQHRLISETTEGRTRLNSTGSHIAGEILSNVQSSIKCSPTLYYKFLDSLKEADEGYYKDVIRKVEEERNKKEQQRNISGGSSMETSYSSSSQVGEDDVFDMETLSNTVIIEVARYINKVKKKKSMAILMGLEAGDWDPIATNGPPEKKHERLAEWWVKKNGERSLQLLENILLEPALQEKRIAREISDSMKSESESPLTSPIEVDAVFPHKDEFDEVEKQACTCPAVLNFLARYASLWEAIGKELIGQDQVRKIKSDRWAEGDEAAYVVEEWWSHTTDEVEFSWKKLKETINKVMEKERQILRESRCEPEKMEVTIRSNKSQRTSKGSIEIDYSSSSQVGEDEVFHKESCLAINYQFDNQYLAKQARDEDSSLLANLNESAALPNLKDNIGALELEFRNIQLKFIDFLKSSRGNIDKFCGFLQQPTGSLLGLEGYFSEKDLEDVTSAKDLQRLFVKLSLCIWNCFDCDVLRVSINACDGPPDLKEKMDSYERRVESLSETFTVKQLLKCWDPPVTENDIPESIKKAVAQMNWNPSTCTVQKLRQLRNRFERTLIPHKTGFAAYALIDIKEGCVMATWFVFTNAWPELMEATRMLFLQDPDFTSSIQLMFFALNDFILHPCLDQETLWNACREGMAGQVRELLRDMKADPNSIYKISQRSALQCAAKHGHQSCAELLLEYGAAIDYQDKTGYTALMIAVKMGQSGMVDYLLSEGANFTIQDNVIGMTPLQAAVNRNDLKCFELLCRYRDIPNILNVRNREGKTALILAAEQGNAEMISTLLKEDTKDLDIDAQDMHGQTALHVAAKLCHIEAVGHLLKYSLAVSIQDKNHDTPVDIARRSEDQKLRDIFRHYFTEEEEMESLSLDVGQEQAMSYSAALQEEGTSSGSKEVEIPLQELSIKEGEPVQEGEQHPEDVETQSALEAEPRSGGRLRRLASSVYQSVVHVGTLDMRLIRAAGSGKVVIAGKVLKKGADPNTKRWDTQLWSALMVASFKGHLDVVKVLLKHGADPNIVAVGTDYTALILACSKGYHEIVECLLDPTNPVKIDIQAVNTATGWGPMLWASQVSGSPDAKTDQGKENRRKIVHHLLKAGVDVNKAGKNGYTPLIQASEDNHLELVKEFCQLEEIEMDRENKNSWTAITTACRAGETHEDIVIELTKSGADINKKKQGGLTALHLACYKGLLRAVKCMVPPRESKTKLPERQKKPEVDVTDDWGMTPLILATKQKHQEVAKYLVTEGGAKVNVTAMKYAQWTAVYFAIQNDDQDMFDFLLENGAKMDITDEHHISPENYAKQMFIKKQIYKHMQHQRKQKQEQEELQQQQRQQEETSTILGRLADLTRYNATEAQWRIRQQIRNITFNI